MPSYPEQIDLPFNFTTIRDDLQLSPPSGRSEEGAGYGILIQGDSPVLSLERESATLIMDALPPGRTDHAP